MAISQRWCTRSCKRSSKSITYKLQSLEQNSRLVFIQMKKVNRIIFTNQLFYSFREYPSMRLLGYLGGGRRLDKNAEFLTSFAPNLQTLLDLITSVVRILVVLIYIHLYSPKMVTSIKKYIQTKIYNKQKRKQKCRNKG